MNNYLLRETAKGNYSYSVAPEIMIGASKKLMLHAEAFFGNAMDKFDFDGAAVYGKYRFYSNDELHKHFRMAVYGRLAFSNNMIMQPAIDLTGKNSGEELGIVATKLLNRFAVSAGTSVLHANDIPDLYKIYLGWGSNAVNYNLSFGKLFLPKEYRDFKQVNLNGMLEFVGQVNTMNGKGYLDLAPSLQVIFLSRLRLDAGYRFPLLHGLYRMQDKGFLLRLEYNLFNAYK